MSEIISSIKWLGLKFSITLRIMIIATPTQDLASSYMWIQDLRFTKIYMQDHERFTRFFKILQNLY